MQSINQEAASQIEQIRQLSAAYYACQDFAHNSDHVSHVLRYAEIIAKGEEANLFLVQAGACLHQFHDNLTELNQLLRKTSLGEMDRELLFHIVEVCRPHRVQESDLIEAKVVYDADALAVISSYGLVRELICNAVVREMPWERSVAETKRVQQLFWDTLQTRTAKMLAGSTKEVCDLFWEDYQKWRGAITNALSPDVA